MTRINLVSPKELTDQHLFSEFREIKMVPKMFVRSLQSTLQREFAKNDSEDFAEERERLAVAAVKKRIPKQFTLNAGHVFFFYDKGQYLFERFQALRAELERRRVDFNRASELDPDDIFGKHPGLLGHYTPTAEALEIIRARITERIAVQPHWYRYMGEPIA